MATAADCCYNTDDSVISTLITTGHVDVKQAKPD